MGVALAVGLLAGAPGLAQQVPPPEPGPAITRATYSNGQVQLRDAVTNAPLIVPRGFPLLGNQDPQVTGQITFQEQPAGYDLIYDMTNTAPVDMGLGYLGVGIITLGLDIEYFDLRESIDPIAANADTFIGQAWDYPTHMYSPAYVLRNGTYAMGISIQYPVLEYEHEVRMNLANPAGEYLSGEGGRGWGARISLSTNGPYSWHTVPIGASLKPGEKRRYVVSVRVTKNPAEWVRTLVPYRNYFRSVYGGVRYVREDTPVWAVNASDTVECNDTNPLGYHLPWRPDTKGWASFATLLRESTGGWGGSMIWKPGGSYRYNTQNNFPCQPASTWLTSAALSTIFDQNTGMPTVARAGKGLGFWWGRSCQTAATWDPPVLEDFDPDNPVHLARGLLEVDLMARAGATWIGLDSFSAQWMPFWKQHRWIQTMRLRYPHIKFVTEPTNCDIMHTLAASFITAWRQAQHGVPQVEEDCYLVKHSNTLADFLLPGHEYWAGFSYAPLTQYFGVQPDLNRVLADMQRFASYGYRPCFAVSMETWGLAIPPGIHAAKSWETTIPADLQLPDTTNPLGLGLSTGSRPTKNGGNVVAGSRPYRTSAAGGALSPGALRFNTSARPDGASRVSGPGARANAAGAGRVSRAIDPRMNSRAEQRRIASALRRIRGLPPLPPEEPASQEGSEVQTFTNDAPAGEPAKVAPAAAPQGAPAPRPQKRPE